MSDHVCPVWVGYLLASPLRKLVQNPHKLMTPYLRPGMTVLEPGSAMGFFTLPMAEMVGPDGRVVAVEVQQKMLDKLAKRAAKAGVAERIQGRLINGCGMPLDDLAGTVDFCPVLNVVHEVDDQALFFGDLHQALKPGGKMLIMEPKGHVKPDEFEEELRTAETAGLQRTELHTHIAGLAALLVKPGAVA